MTHDEARALLLTSARLNLLSEQFREQASTIVEELGYLALAIDQAGAYIANGECYLDDFLEVFNAHRQRLLQNEAYRGGSESDRAVYATWDLSYAAICRQANGVEDTTVSQGAKAALQILRVFPFFHNEGIMEDIFRLAAEYSESQSKAEVEADTRFPSSLLKLRPDGKWESQSFRQGIQTLLSFSLIGRESEPRRFHMHRLVHLWAYDSLTEAERGRFCDQARNVLARSIPWQLRISDFTFRRDLIPHVANLLRQSSLCPATNKEEGIEEFGMAFWEAGRWKEAEELTMQLLETRKKMLDEEHPEMLRSMGNIAMIYSQQERWKEAEELRERVVEIKKRALGEEHPSTLANISDLASIYKNTGRWKEAEELEVQNIKSMKRVLGEEHDYTLGSMKNLASIFSRQGRRKGAEELKLKEVEMAKRVLDQEHPDTLMDMKSLACSNSAQRRLQEAEEILVFVLEKRKRVLGLEHPHTLSTMGDLSMAIWDQGRYEEALTLGEQCLKLQKQTLGPEHPNTLTSMSGIALIFWHQGRREEAIPLLEDCLNLQEQVIGPENPSTQLASRVLDEWKSQRARGYEDQSEEDEFRTEEDEGRGEEDDNE